MYRLGNGLLNTFNYTYTQLDVHAFNRKIKRNLQIFIEQNIHTILVFLKLKIQQMGQKYVSCTLHDVVSVVGVKEGIDMDTKDHNTIVIPSEKKNYRNRTNTKKIIEKKFNFKRM